MNAYTKDILRSIRKNGKRFVALMIIMALGVCMLIALRASCQDLRYSADDFYDKQNLFDVTIVSTYGLTEEDIKVMEKLPEVDMAEGGYSETVFTTVKDKTKQISLHVLSQKGINVPYLLEGTMPTEPTEILVTRDYLSDTELKIGDTVQITEKCQEKEVPNFIYREYKICGVVVDACNINTVEGAISFRNTSSTDYTFFVLPDAVSYDIYTVAYLTLKDSQSLLCYSDAYEEKVAEFVSYLEKEIKSDRENARYEQITGDAYDQIADAEQDMEDTFSDAQQKLDDARKELEEARKELEQGANKLSDAEKELLKGRIDLLKAELELERREKEYQIGLKELEAAKEQIKEGEQKLAEGEQKLAEGEEQLKKAEESFFILEDLWNRSNEQIKEHYAKRYAYLEAEMAEKKEKYEQSDSEVEKQLLELRIKSIESSLKELREQEERAYQQLEESSKVYFENKAKIEESRAELEKGKSELESARSQLELAKEEVRLGTIELEEGRKQLDEAKLEIENGWKEIEQGEKDLEQGKTELEDGKNQLEEGKTELDKNVAEFEDEKQNAMEELESARQEVSAIEMTTWYISTRDSLGGYCNINSDSDCIESIGMAFPVIFTPIAILVSLTTMSRMVEEDRGLIGTYKALGFTNREIRRKYVLYAFLACIFGGILGNILGFLALPKILIGIFGEMYQLQDYKMIFEGGLGCVAVIFYLLAILGATVYSCHSILSETPAILMRAKTPSLGSRVFMERITPLWSRLSFLNKVTARNLFRYKKRLFMTLFGIAGCTAILLSGYTIKDTITDLLPRQFEQTSVYDLMAVSNDNESLLKDLEGRDIIKSYINPMISKIKIKNQDGKEETVQLIVLPEGESLEGYIHLYDKKNRDLSLKDGDVFTTNNVSTILNYEKGDTITLQTLDLDTAEIKVTEITVNYLGNYVYMTQSTYEELFGGFHANGVIAHLNGNKEERKEFTEELSMKENILTIMDTSAVGENMDDAFRIINLVVTIVIVMAASLAFVVLFTLSTTNISERDRELATIKVLGFYDKEVHLYVNKETLILTFLGILLGMPLGKIFGAWLISVLDMPSMYFADTLFPISYVIAGAMAMLFALTVNFITDRLLDRINPVEALKSIE